MYCWYRSWGLRAPAAGQTCGVFHRLGTMKNVAVCCTSIWNVHLHSLPYIHKKKDDDKSVNIFRKSIYCLTSSLPELCKTYCFTFQKRLFCTVKAVVLRCKTYAFATPKRIYHFLTELLLQNVSPCRQFKFIRLH